MGKIKSLGVRWPEGGPIMFYRVVADRAEFDATDEGFLHGFAYSLLKLRMVPGFYAFFHVSGNVFYCRNGKLSVLNGERCHVRQWGFYYE